LLESIVTLDEVMRRVEYRAGAVRFTTATGQSQAMSPPPKHEALAKRRVLCMVAFLHPFRLVNAPSSPPWDVTVDEVNCLSWDYAALHEMVGGVDVGLPAPYHMVIARDGGVALPSVPQLRNDQEAVEFFNRCFAALLLGGFYCEVIGLDGLDFGSIIGWKYTGSKRGRPQRLTGSID
jgi:hypothetical protein